VISLLTRSLTAAGAALALQFVLSAGAWAAESLDTIIIDSGYDRQTRIAVVPFGQGQEFANLTPMADIVSADLSRSGQFAPLPKANMLSYPTVPKDVFMRDWRVLGVEYVVIGTAATGPNDTIATRFHLFDVVNEREMLSDQVTGTRRQWRDIAHKVSDKVYQAITGIPGAFSTKILYVLARNVGSPTASYSIEIADSDGERSRSLFTSKQPVMSPGWSPDGRKIAYVSFETGRQAIVLQDIFSGQRELITNFTGINSSPVFSPDGRNLTLVLSKDGNPELYLMNLADRRLRRLTQHPGIDTEPSWSEDGRYVIFTSDRGGKPQIYQLELATNMTERLTFVGNYNTRARLLPGGKTMVFVHRRDMTDHIAWQDLARGDVRVLTQTALDESPSVAPNGAMLIYATQDRGRGILGVVSLDGRVRYRLPSSSGDVREPSWSPYLDLLGGGW
jgi:TolB protein